MPSTLAAPFELDAVRPKEVYIDQAGNLVLDCRDNATTVPDRDGEKRDYLQRIYGGNAELSPDGQAITINMRWFYHRNSTARERRQVEAEMLGLVADQAHYSPNWPWPRDVVPEVRFRNRR